MSKIRIITDSAADLVAPERTDLTILPLRIHFGDAEYADRVTLSPQTFYEKLIESDTLPTTSLIPPATFDAAYRTAVEAGEQVLAITLSSRLSGTYQSALLAAEAYGAQVRVVDSRSATVGQQILVRYAMRLSDQGRTLDEIADELERAREDVRVLGLLGTLDYLKKGGRISSTVAFVGSALSIKPVVTVRDGEVVLLGKARGSKNGNNFLMKEIEKANGVDFTMPFCLGYTGLEDSLLQKYITDSQFLWVEHTEALPICIVGPTIGTHIGPDAIAVAFFAKK